MEKNTKKINNDSLLKKITAQNFLKFLQIGLIIGVIAFAATIPAFFHASMKIGTDGPIHADRIEQIFESLRNGKLPAQVSFIGLGGKVTAMASMYPWLTTLIMVVPKFFVTPVHAWFFGYFLLNFITGATAYLLTSELTDNICYRIFGSLIYTFSGYHLILLYARTAMGEALAYAFYPLIVYGCFRIWREKKYSWFSLALGMILIANSHILSLVFATFFIAVTEIWRIVRKKFNTQEFMQFLFAGLLSLLGSLYAIYSILILQLGNKMSSPFTSIESLDPVKVLDTIISNKFYEESTSWNIGLGVTIFVAYALFIGLAKYKSFLKQKWQKWLIASILSQLFLFSWLPWKTFQSTPLSIVQFLGRFLGLSSILIMIALVMFLNTEKLTKRAIIISALLISFLGISSIYNYERDPSTDTASNIHYRLNSTTYKQLLQKVGNPDYIPYQTFKGKKILLIDSNPKLKMNVINESYDSISYSVHSNVKGSQQIPIAYYRNVPYRIYVNQKNVNSLSKTALVLKLRKGTNVIRITSNPSKKIYEIFLVSIFGLLVSVFGLFFNFLKV